MCVFCVIVFFLGPEVIFNEYITCAQHFALWIVQREGTDILLTGRVLREGFTERKLFRDQIIS